FMLVNSHIDPNGNTNQFPINPTPGDQLDSPLNVAPTGALHVMEYDSWNVLDSVGGAGPSQGAQGDIGYGYVNFVDTTTPGQTNCGTPNSTIIGGPFLADYFGRANENAGWVASDWYGTSGIAGTIIPYFGTGSSGNTNLSSGANRPLNNIGGPNFDSSLQQPAVVTAAKATVTVAVGATAIVDPTVTVTDPDSSFLGSTKVAITGNFSQGNDTLTYP